MQEPLILMKKIEGLERENAELRDRIMEKTVVSNLQDGHDRQMGDIAARLMAENGRLRDWIKELECELDEAFRWTYKLEVEKRKLKRELSDGRSMFWDTVAKMKADDPHRSAEKCETENMRDGGGK